MGLATRLSDKDTLVGLGVALALLVAMGGIFAYERTQFGEYPLTWSAVEAGSEARSGTANAGQSVPFTFEVTDDGVTRVRVQLAWTDANGDPDVFRLRIRAPDGTETVSSESPTSPLDLAVQVTPLPTQPTGPGRSPEAAADQARAEQSTDAGTGTWTVTVELVRAPGTTLGGQEVQADGSNGFDLRFAWDTVAVVAGPDKV